MVDKRTGIAIEVADNGNDVLMPMLTLSPPISGANINCRKRGAVMQESYTLQKQKLQIH